MEWRVFFGSHLAKAEPTVKKYLGLTLLPQAGVAIGMANMVEYSLGENGKIIYTIVLCATLVYELVGPLLTKLALEKANEIDKNTGNYIGKHSLVKTRRLKKENTDNSKPIENN